MTKNLFMAPFDALVILGVGVLSGCGTPIASRPTPAQNHSFSTAAVPSVTKSSITTPKTKFTFWSILPLGGGIACDVQFNTAFAHRVFTMANFKDVHLWDHGNRFTFILLSVHVDLHPNPPLASDWPKTILNHNIPVHNNWVTSVRLHPIGNTLEVTCSLSHPANHFTLGTTPTLFEFSFSK